MQYALTSVNCQLSTKLKMTYKETLKYLYERLPMFTRIGEKAFKKDLTNTRALCTFLDNPQNKFPSIHIAGTNGKGSTSHIIAAVLQSLGLKVGLYTSPHYVDFRERIKINGEYISTDFVKRFVKKTEAIVEEIEPSFFELTVAMAFDYFASHKVDIAVIEVGLGGRFDSTNVINPLLSLITNISLDHVDMLGDTLAKIAFEKAGIIKPNIPVVIGEYNSETQPVFINRAKELNAQIYFASDAVQTTLINEDNTGMKILVDSSQLSIDSPRLSHRLSTINCQLSTDLKGTYQLLNLNTSYYALQVLKYNSFFKNYSETEWQKAIEHGFANVKSLQKLIGRWQILKNQPLVIADSAHNEGGLTIVVNDLMKLNASKYHIVLGFVRDKDISKVLNLFPPKAIYYFCNAQIPRALPSKNLKELARKFGLLGRNYATCKSAYKAALNNAATNDVIFIGGSIFVVGEILS